MKIESPLFEVLNGGPLTTVQDLGRFGYQWQGISPCGAMDELAYVGGNLLVGNSPGEAALEITLQGPTLRVLKDCIVSVTGGHVEIFINGESQPSWESFRVDKGNVISVGPVVVGCRAYLCVAGGIAVPSILGSKSTDLRVGFGGFHGRKLLRGDLISTTKTSVDPWSRLEGRRVPFEVLDLYEEFFSQKIVTLKAVKGPEDYHFTSKALTVLGSEIFSVSAQSNRMGYRLEGPKIEHNDRGPDIVTNCIPLGAIQIPGSGQPIVLLKDRQTSGGYAKIGVVASSDIYKLAQLRPGAKVSFQWVDLAAVHNMARDRKNLLSEIKFQKLGPARFFIIYLGQKKYNVTIKPWL